MNDIEIFEQWRTISGFPNYQVSNVGRVIDVRNGQIQFQAKLKIGYFTVSLGTDKSSMKYVHHLVAQEFLTKPDDGQRYEIDHKDRDRSNNSVNNLRYATSSQNKMNIEKRKRNNATSAFKGVSLNKRKQLW